ncbi:MAG: maleylacetoacetate isomerase [Myxococcales bacterium]|nr:maleylacetoacetate isomerase [Myxococcales bacterium]
MNLVLHNYWRSSASYRVRIGLGLKGLAYAYRVVNIIKDGGAQHGADYRAKNPMAQVPTLEVVDDDGVAIFLTQSLPILEYLDERWPHAPLLPGGATHAAMVTRARARALAELVNTGIQPLQNLSTTRKVKELGGDDRAWVGGFISTGLAAYEAAAGDGHPFSIGDAPTIADCFLVPQLYSARRFGVDVERFPRLLAIEAACNALPGFAAAHPDRQPDAVV